MTNMIQQTSVTWQQPGSGLAASRHVRPERLAPTFAPVTGRAVRLRGTGLPGGPGLQGARLGAEPGGAMTAGYGSGLPVQVFCVERTVRREAFVGVANTVQAAALTVPATALTVPATDSPTTDIPTTPVRTDKHDPGSTVWRESV